MVEDGKGNLLDDEDDDAKEGADDEENGDPLETHRIHPGHPNRRSSPYALRQIVAAAAGSRGQGSTGERGAPDLKALPASTALRNLENFSGQGLVFIDLSH